MMILGTVIVLAACGRSTTDSEAKRSVQYYTYATCTEGGIDHGYNITFIKDFVDSDIQMAHISEKTMIGPQPVHTLNYCESSRQGSVFVTSCSDTDRSTNISAQLIEDGFSGIPQAFLTIKDEVQTYEYTLNCTIY
jgi:hypothetical protein